MMPFLLYVPLAQIVRVTLAATVNIMFGMVWYSSWFLGRVWKMKNVRIRAGRDDRYLYVATFGAALFFAWMLDAILKQGFAPAASAIALPDLIALGFLIWFGSIVATLIERIIWKEKVIKWWVIVAGYASGSVLIQSLILLKLG